MARDIIKTVEEAQKFLEETYEHAKTLTQKEAAKLMEKSAPAFNTALTRASALAQRPVPVFKNFLNEKKEKKKDLNTKVMAGGKGGVSKRVPIPQHAFEKQGWELGDHVKITLKRNGDIVLSRIKEEPSTSEKEAQAQAAQKADSTPKSTAKKVVRKKPAKKATPRKTVAKRSVAKKPQEAKKK